MQVWGSDNVEDDNNDSHEALFIEEAMEKEMEDVNIEFE